MSQSYVGIDNVNEFYSQHYLAAVVANDLKPILARWRDHSTAPDGEASDTPPQRLGKLHRAFFNFRERFGETRAIRERVALQTQFLSELISTLGFAPRLELVEIEGDAGGHIPVLASCTRGDGSPLLWWVPAIPGSAAIEPPTTDMPTQGRLFGGRFAPQQLALPTTESLMESRVLEEQLAGVPFSGIENQPEPTVPTATLEDLVTAAFDLPQPPRFVLLAGPTEIWLLERAKWLEQRTLRFDLAEILGRRDEDTLSLTAVLLHRESLAPDAGEPLIDALDDRSHKHAFAVSTDLKYALRESIELLGNAAIAQLREGKKGIYGRDLADQVSRECLTFMYRLLFIFYLEARPELGYAPINAEAYLKGYSLERLRDLESVTLHEPESRDGSYIHECLTLLFRMIHDGTASQPSLPVDGEATAASVHGTFSLAPLSSHLFDPERTKLLGSIRLPNYVLRRVIELMSLTRPGSGRRRGRISYATLGINQLGAVYEALLAFRGFFAEQDLYEVKKAGDDEHDELATAYLVSAEDLRQYREEEWVVDRETRAIRKYTKGTFIYRMAGRDRQKSASYYTPQSLTRTVVKYALKELLEDEKGEPRLSAEEILQLRVMEPAVGSAAFLNEAVDQLADAYLSRRQKEMGERIPHDCYAWEKQRAKMYIADNNVFGVDMNPVAIELAEVSLWLNTIHQSAFVPWFGMQLLCGNSLVGARRQAFPTEEVDPGAQQKEAPWLEAVPEHVPVGATRPTGAIWHFLLPDRGMAVFGQGTEGAPIRQMCEGDLAKIEEWRRSVCKPLSADERTDLEHLSEAVDHLWAEHVTMLRDVRQRTTDPLSVFGREHPEATRQPSTTRYKDEIWRAEMATEGVRASSPYRRLKLALDYWCALWFWPLEKADELPSRDEWLLDLAAILAMDVLPGIANGNGGGETGEQLPLFAPNVPEERKQALRTLGIVDLPALVEKTPRLQLVQDLAKRYRFLHWELEAADIFADRGGFDLIVGNPPWIRVQWSEGDVLGDFDPLFVLRKLSAPEVSQRRDETLRRYDKRGEYLLAHEEAAAIQNFLSAKQNYAVLEGTKINLYKAFLPQAWTFSRPSGASGFLHPEGLYDEPQGGALRRAAYPRLRRHYQFQNEFNLFEGTNDHGRMRFSVNVYGPREAAPRIVHIANLYTPSTIEECHSHPGSGPVPGIKNDDDQWNTSGHRDRIVDVGLDELQTFAAVYDEPGTPADEARLPAVHSKFIVQALRTLARSRRFGQASQQFGHDLWNETRAQRAGTISAKTCFPASPSDWIISGPHFFVASPMHKSPRRICTQSSQYDVVDLMSAPDDYLPRTNYVRGCSETEYLSRVPKVPWGVGGSQPLTSFFRVVCSRALSLAAERTLQPAIVPPGAANIDSVYSYLLSDPVDMVQMAGFWSSLSCDFLVKTSGVDDFRPNLARRMPLPSGRHERVAVRALCLNCVTNHYADLWARCWSQSFRQDSWSKEDVRLRGTFFAGLASTWSRESTLRAAFERRQALVELDVLVAMALGLSLTDLQEIYRIQFPVLQNYERNTFYDQNGRIVFTVNRGLPGVGLEAKPKNRNDQGPFWQDVKDMRSGSVEQTIDDDTLPGGPHRRTIVYEAPFTVCNREDDYREAWAVFEKRRA